MNAPVVRILFWNVARNEDSCLWSLLDDCEQDLIILAECPSTSPAPAGFARRNIPQSSVAIFSRSGMTELRVIHDDPKGRVVVSVLDGEWPLMIVACHLPSKLHRTVEHQLLRAMQVRQMVERLEGDDSRRRTLIVGDMNMDPHEMPMVHCLGFHAVMSAAIAADGSRVVDGEMWRFFYNPMWGHFGDRTQGPPGTYYRSAGAAVQQHWHMFDQVLLRPLLVESLLELSVVERIGPTSLLSRSGLPAACFSDHLPLSATIALGSWPADVKGLGHG